jgi:hypothetical protein
MISFGGKIEGDTRFKEDTRLTGMVTGSATVESRVTLELGGTIGKTLRLLPGSTVYLRGTVHDVVNDGGHLEVWGTIGGLLLENSGHTVVHRDAMVSGVRR